MTERVFRPDSPPPTRHGPGPYTLRQGSPPHPQTAPAPSEWPGRATVPSAVGRVVTVPFAFLTLGLFVITQFAVVIVLGARTGALELATIALTASLVAVGLFVQRRIPLRQLLGRLDRLPRRIGLGLAIGVASVLGSSLLVVVLMSLLGRSAPPEQLVLQEAMSGGRSLLLATIVAVILAPLSEELIFRGLLHQGLRNRLRVVPATLLSSGIFAVVHGEVVASQPLSLIGLFFVGVVLAVTFERTGGLLVPIVVHAAFNATMIAIALVAFGLGAPDPAAEGAVAIGRLLGAQ